jgi:hypothetical protein
VIVTVEVAPPAVGVRGVVPVTLHAGNGVPPPTTEQVRFTPEAYPSKEVKVTVEVAVPPGATGVGGVAVIVKFCAFTVRSTVAE